jgi:hypothetical protein
VRTVAFECRRVIAGGGVADFLGGDDTGREDYQSQRQRADRQK